MIRVLSAALVLSLLAFAPSSADAKKSKPKAKAKAAKLTKEDKEFQERLAALKKDTSKLIIVKMLPTDDPAKVPSMDGGAGVMLVANHRSDIYTPETLSPQDILQVINKHMIDVRKCYKKQLAEDPEWNDELILDLSVKKTGRVSEVSISPRRVSKDVIGACLISSVPKWEFPKFTGEGDDGVTQEVVNASFPFSLSTN